MPAPVARPAAPWPAGWSRAGSPRCCATVTRRSRPTSSRTLASRPAHASRSASPGASGLIGRTLTHFLTTGGHRVVRFVRGQRTPQPSPPSDVEPVVDAPWDPARGFLQPDRLPRLDAVRPPRRGRRRRQALDATADGAHPRQPRPGHDDSRSRARRAAGAARGAPLRLRHRVLRLRRHGAAGRDRADGRRLPRRGLRANGRRPPTRRAPPASASPTCVSASSSRRPAAC